MGVGLGFDLLLERADDLSMDTPQLVPLLSRFLARAVADEVIPPKYVRREGPGGAAASPQAAAMVVHEAQTLLAMPHALARLSAIWGGDTGRRPVVQLSRQMHVILQARAQCTPTATPTHAQTDR
jgi:hypothetical protein